MAIFYRLGFLLFQSGYLGVFLFCHCLEALYFGLGCLEQVSQLVSLEHEIVDLLPQGQKFISLNIGLGLFAVLLLLELVGYGLHLELVDLVL